eukprot:8211169-Pyramimonas_sp.AAC.1
MRTSARAFTSARKASSVWSIGLAGVSKSAPAPWEVTAPTAAYAPLSAAPDVAADVGAGMSGEQTGEV